MINKRDLLRTIGAVIVLVFLAFGVYLANVQQTAAQGACYRAQGGAKWVGASGCEWETQAGSTLDVQGDLQLTPPTITAVAASFTIVPASAYMVITSTAEVTSSATAAITTTSIGTGETVIIRNGNASNVINIDGTGGTVECKANIALGASDVVALIYNGTDWNCLYVRDNS